MPACALCASSLLYSVPGDEHDLRGRRGRRHLLGCVLLVALCGARSLSVIGQWAASAPQHALTRLGARIISPELVGLRQALSPATIRRVLTRLTPRGG